MGALAVELSMPGECREQTKKLSNLTVSQGVLLAQRALIQGSVLSLASWFSSSIFVTLL